MYFSSQLLMHNHGECTRVSQRNISNRMGESFSYVYIKYYLFFYNTRVGVFIYNTF